MTTRKTPNYEIVVGQSTKRINVVAKPIGASCNIDCTYCYYLSKSDLLNYKKGCSPVMSDAQLERYIQQYITGQNHHDIVFNWQGGEPTLLGIDYFERVVELQRQYKKTDTTIMNNFQTNGMLLNDQWCEFFKRNQFHIGISIDGPEMYHNAYRKTKSGKGTFKQVMRAIHLLKKHSVSFSTLTCVNALTSRNPLEIYRFLRDEVQSPQMQFIPIVEKKKDIDEAPQHWRGDQLIQGDERLDPSNDQSIMLPWSVSDDAWGDFLISVFNEWSQQDVGRVAIQYFESLINVWAGGVSSICTLGELCGKGMAIEPNGDVYSCDHFVFPEYKLGNINQASLGNMSFSKTQQDFGYSKSKRLNSKCRECSYKFACYGECPKNRFIQTSNGEDGLNYLCAGWYKFLSHVDHHIAYVIRRMGYPVMHGQYSDDKRSNSGSMSIRYSNYQQTVA